MLRTAINEILFVCLKRLIDRIIPASMVSKPAKSELRSSPHSQEIGSCGCLQEGAALARPDDLWTRRARPTFLYVMYAIMLGALPVGLVAAIDPKTADAIAEGVAAYLRGLPEPLYALFGTGYLGYATLRQWGKAKAQER